ncbi:hypothetical protein CNMCM6457_007102 [Aspergillus fumigatiaffinis]|nr:hypothetical protein CNMCM6457_007102 [Aspergillus fumigatiaffinis]
MHPSISHRYGESPPPYEEVMSGQIDVTVKVKQPGLESLLPDNRSADSPPLPEVPLSAVKPLNIVIQIVGSRALLAQVPSPPCTIANGFPGLLDVQPFIALGTRLRRDGHRIWLATHENFKELIQNSGLEFFSIGGNPEELMSCMVKNTGIIPKMSTITGGEIGRKREMIADMLHGSVTQAPFVADAIIANPPGFAHIHCAQALGVPLHMMFTMPRSPTREFPHPLANIKDTGADASLTYYLSYSMVELFTWSGLADIINSGRVKSLNLEELSPRTASGLMERLQVPHTYCWSLALIPKPSDWPPYIDVCGFFFRGQPSYSPSPEIEAFLRNESKPIYIGFKSIVMDDPAAMTTIIQAACRQAGVRLDFRRVAFQTCCRRYTPWWGRDNRMWSIKWVSNAIVPFFGDQPFWAKMVAAAGAGPAPIDHKALTAQGLADAIRFCLSLDSQRAAASIAARMGSENGVSNAAASFYRHIPWEAMQCDLLPSETAKWSLTNFYTGFADGLTGIVTKPYREAKSDGASGFAKGLAKGSVGLFSKPGAAMLGLVAYPAMGIYKKEAFVDTQPQGSSTDLIGNDPSRSKTRKALDLWQWLRTPLGILITLYGLNVVAWGGMLFLLLCNAAPAMCDPSCNDPNSPRRKWIEIDSQILNALFCIPGFGLAPWRMRDLYLWIRWRTGKDDAAFARLRHTHRAWFDYAPEEVNPKGAGIAQETVDVSGDTTPLWKMSMVVWCNALNTVFQACLAAYGTASAIIVLDYGRDVEGYGTFQVTRRSGNTSVFEMSYSETRALLDTYMADGPLPLAAAMDTYRVNRYNITDEKTYTNRLIQGALRYQKLNLSSGDDTPLSELPGTFNCSDHVLNRIWETGARTVQLNELPAASLPEFWTITNEGALVDSLVPQPFTADYAAMMTAYNVDFAVKPIANGFGFTVLSDTLGNGIYIFVDIANAAISAHAGSSELSSTPLASAALPPMITLNQWHRVGAAVNVTWVSVKIDGVSLLDFSQTIARYGSFGLGASFGHTAVFTNVTLTAFGGQMYASSLSEKSALKDFLLGTNPLPVSVDGSRQDRIAYAGDLDITARAAFASTNGTKYINGSIALLGSMQMLPGFFVPNAKIQQEPRAEAIPANLTGLIGYSFSLASAMAQYYEQTGDIAFLKYCAPRAARLFDWAHSQTLHSGLLNISDVALGGDWNYYDPPLSGWLPYLADGGLNDTIYAHRLHSLQESIRANLWSDRLHAFYLSDSQTDFSSQEANALAILSDTVPSTGGVSARTLLSSMARSLFISTGALAFSHNGAASGWSQKVSPYASGYHLQAALHARNAATATYLLHTLWGPISDPAHANYTGCTWETLGTSGRPGLSAPTSLCHAWGSAPTAELSRHVLGIRAATPGFRRWKVEPVTLGLQWVRGRHPVPGAQFRWTGPLIEMACLP